MEGQDGQAIRPRRQPSPAKQAGQNQQAETHTEGHPRHPTGRTGRDDRGRRLRIGRLRCRTGSFLHQDSWRLPERGETGLSDLMHLHRKVDALEGIAPVPLPSDRFQPLGTPSHCPTRTLEDQRTGEDLARPGQ